MELFSRKKRHAVEVGLSILDNLLNAEEPVVLHDFSGHIPMDEITIDMKPPTADEVDKAIAHLKKE